MPHMEWQYKPPRRHGYYLAAYRRGNMYMVSELWFNPDSLNPGWWASRSYFGEAPRAMPVDVIAWMPKPVYEEQDGTQPDAASEEGGETAL